MFRCERTLQTLEFDALVLADHPQGTVQARVLVFGNGLRAAEYVAEAVAGVLLILTATCNFCPGQVCLINDSQSTVQPLEAERDPVESTDG